MFVDGEEVKRKIVDLLQKQAGELGVRRNTFQEIKKRIREYGA